MPKIPHPIICVAIGLISGLLGVISSGSVSHEVLMFAFLPPLLFEAAWNLHLDELKRRWMPVAALATVGALVSMLIAAWLLVATHQLDWSTALVFGAIVAATDPVSVVAVFRKLNVDKGLTALLEGESLFNDGTAVALFYLSLANATQHQAFSWEQAAGKFAVIVGGGIVVGLVIGFIVQLLESRVRFSIGEILLTSVAAYSSFWIADHLHVSPVLSVVTAGIVMGNAGHKHLTQKVFIEVDDFWTIVALLVNTIVFFLIGVEARVSSLLESLQLVSIGVGATLLSRLVTVVPLCSLASLTKSKIPWRWQALIYWGGLRGALSMLMALSLPRNIEHHHELMVLTFGVVLFTLVIQGLTIEPLIAKLGIKS